MASKRFIKKQIRLVCGDIAGECITASWIIKKADSEKLRQCIIETAQLQSSALKHINISFDKTPKSFTSIRDYRKARRQYFKAAVKSFEKGFYNKVDEIVKEMNKAVPAE